jgi:hypothetical protein
MVKTCNKGAFLCDYVEALAGARNDVVVLVTSDGVDVGVDVQGAVGGAGLEQVADYFAVELGDCYGDYFGGFAV